MPSQNPSERFIARMILALAATASQGGVIYVDAVEGDDATGGYSTPFETPEAARDFASGGDCIVVRPGTYAVTSSLLVDLVNWYLMEGATITRLIGTYVFDDEGAVITSRIGGHGAIGGAGGVVKMAAASDLQIALDTVNCADLVACAAGAGVLRLRANSIRITGSCIAVTAAGSPTIYVDADSIISTLGGGINIAGVAPRVYVKARYIQTSENNGHNCYSTGVGRLFIECDEAVNCFFASDSATGECYAKVGRHYNPSYSLATASVAGGLLSYEVKTAIVGAAYGFPAIQAGPGTIRVKAGSNITNLGAGANANPAIANNAYALILESGVSLISADALAPGIDGAVQVLCYGAVVGNIAKAAGVTIVGGTYAANANVV